MPASGVGSDPGTTGLRSGCEVGVVRPVDGAGAIGSTSQKRRREVGLVEEPAGERRAGRAVRLEEADQLDRPGPGRPADRPAPREADCARTLRSSRAAAWRPVGS